MEVCIQLFLVASLTLYGINCQVNPTLGKPWPKPQKYQASSAVFLVDSKSFQFVTTGQDCDLLKPAYARYLNYTFKGYNAVRDGSHDIRPTSADVIQKLEVSVTSCGKKYPDVGSKEDYTLSIGPGTAKLQATEVWGALRGLETFSQIVYRNKTGEFQVNQVDIADFPRFPHRGFLLDTARHFISMRNIFRMLDAIAQNKMNVFHWHIVDDQSFPFISATFPELSQKGAYNPVSHVYTPADVADVIEYARLRGIRVIPEFDSPGHSQSWGKSHPELLTKCYQGNQPNGLMGPVDPTHNGTYQFLTKLYTELSQVFSDRYLHLGGDEVSFNCWQSNPDIKAFMSKNNIKDYAGLEAYYLQQVVDIATKVNKGSIVWQEVVDNGVKVPNDTIVAVWKGGWQAETAKVTSLGYTTLMSGFECWYLDYISYGQDWTRMYSCDPTNFNGTAAQKALVIGGEASLWVEFVDNSNVISRAWPRASAVAEKLWSAESVNDVNDARSRIAEQRCRMVRRGLPAEPITGPGFCEKEYQSP